MGQDVEWPLHDPWRTVKPLADPPGVKSREVGGDPSKNPIGCCWSPVINDVSCFASVVMFKCLQADLSLSLAHHSSTHTHPESQACHYRSWHVWAFMIHDLPVPFFISMPGALSSCGSASNYSVSLCRSPIWQKNEVHLWKALCELSRGTSTNSCTLLRINKDENMAQREKLCYAWSATSLRRWRSSGRIRRPLHNQSKCLLTLKDVYTDFSAINESFWTGSTY